MGRGWTLVQRAGARSREARPDDPCEGVGAYRIGKNRYRQNRGAIRLRRTALSLCWHLVWRGTFSAALGRRCPEQSLWRLQRQAHVAGIAPQGKWARGLSG